jgi:hypothetical protein
MQRHAICALGLGMMLWMTHFFPDEDWARTQKARCLSMLDRMWMNEGYFCREPGLYQITFAFTNYGVSVGLQAVNAMPERVRALSASFESYRSGTNTTGKPLPMSWPATRTFRAISFEALADRDCAQRFPQSTRLLRLDGQRYQGSGLGLRAHRRRG